MQNAITYSTLNKVSQSMKHDTCNFEKKLVCYHILYEILDMILNN